MQKHFLVFSNRLSALLSAIIFLMRIFPTWPLTIISSARMAVERASAEFAGKRSTNGVHFPTGTVDFWGSSVPTAL